MFLLINWVKFNTVKIWAIYFYFRLLSLKSWPIRPRTYRIDHWAVFSWFEQCIRHNSRYSMQYSTIWACCFGYFIGIYLSNKGDRLGACWDDICGGRFTSSKSPGHKRTYQCRFWALLQSTETAAGAAHKWRSVSNPLCLQAVPLTSCSTNNGPLASCCGTPMHSWSRAIQFFHLMWEGRHKQGFDSHTH